jgi:hypothetical protein
MQVGTIADLDVMYPTGNMKKLFQVFGFDSCTGMAEEFRKIRNK